MNFELANSQSNKAIGDSAVDATTPASKKDQLLERLNKRNKDRQNYLDVKLEQRQRDTLQLEGADYFAHSFTERVHTIESHIQQINEAAAAKNAKNVALNTTDLAKSFADITMEIQELERYMSTSTMFLTDFRIKACQNVLSELTACCEETRLRLIPKKRFGFSGKKVAPKSSVNPRMNSSVKGDAQEKTDKASLAKTVFTWTLSSRNNEHIRLQGAQVNGQDITISNLKNCLIELQGYAGSVQISEASNCTFLFGPIARSVFAEQCENCVLAVACQQLRMHSSCALRIYLHVTCRAIIEDCQLIEIGAYNYTYATIEDDFQCAGLNKTQNNYTDVADFNWLSPDVPSPNWQLLKGYADPNWNELCAKFKEQNPERVTL